MQFPARFIHLLGSEKQDHSQGGEMDPNGVQCSINYPFNDNLAGYPRYTLSRLFKSPHHKVQACKAFLSFFIVLLSLITSNRENRARDCSCICVKPLRINKRQPEVDQGRSTGGRQLARPLMRATLIKRQDGALPEVTDLFNLSNPVSIQGNPRVFVLFIMRRNKTRILFVWDPIKAFFWVFITAHQAKTELDVAYTVIRPHSALECTFALISDYLKDFCSFYFREKRALCTRFMGEFNSHTAQLNMVLDQEKNKEGLAC